MIIAIKLVRNKTELPRAIDILPNPMPIPITASGGTNDAAIATPARPAAIFFQPNAKKATRPEAKAMPRSTSVGSVLIAISLVTWVRGRRRVIRKATKIPPTILIKSVRNERPRRFLFPVVVANPTAWIGLRIGAIIMAHITTGVALISNHSVATTIERNI